MDKTTSQEMLAHAEKLCAQRGVRLTPQRLEVLRLMSLQQGAISAYDLLICCVKKSRRRNRRRSTGRWSFYSSRVRAQGGIDQQLCAVPSFRSADPQLGHVYLRPLRRGERRVKAWKILCIRWRPEWASPCATT
jgi:hypothetical protein